MKKSGFFLSGKKEKYGCRAGSQEGKKPGKNAKKNFAVFQFLSNKEINMLLRIQGDEQAKS